MVHDKFTYHHNICATIDGYENIPLITTINLLFTQKETIKMEEAHPL